MKFRRIAAAVLALLLASPALALAAATGTASPYVALQFFTNTGTPAAGYQLFTYTAGTSTKVATYTDVALSSANTNPIILDSAGRCTIFLTPNLSYKYVLAIPTESDPPLSVVWTRDNVSAVPPTGSGTDVDVSGTAGEALSAGNAVYLSDGSGGKTASRWYKADSANYYSSVGSGQMGFAPASITSGSSGSIRITGRITGLTSLTAGSVYYVGTSGAITATAPTLSRAIAVADSTTSVIVGPWVTVFAPQFSTTPIFRPGTASNATVPQYYATGSGMVYSDNTSTSGATGAGSTVCSTTIYADTISAANKHLRLIAHGTTAANANNKTWAYTLGVAALTFPTVASNNFDWTLIIDVARSTASNAETTHYNLFLNPANGGGTGVTYGGKANNSRDLTTNQAISLTITSGTASGDIVYDGCYIEVVG